MSEYQQEVDKWITQYEEGYWPPMVNLACLTEEVGELARILNHLYGKKKKKSSEDEQNLTEEIGDVLFVLACIATATGVDLDEAFAIHMKKSYERDKDRFIKKSE